MYGMNTSANTWQTFPLLRQKSELLSDGQQVAVSVIAHPVWWCRIAPKDKITSDTYESIDPSSSIRLKGRV